MRSFQVMRYGRRTTPTTNELAQSIIQSNNSTPTPRRQSTAFIFDHTQRQNSIQYDENDDLIVLRYGI